MRYDGKIREKLKLVRLNDGKIEYELSYLLSPTCRTFTTLKKVEIINYVDEYYFSKNQIDYDNFYDNLINDINVFKSYRDDVDINVRKENDFNQFVMMVIAIITILVSIFKNNKVLIIALIPLSLIGYGYFMFTISSHSESYKLKVINNVIYTLEAIKEDMDKNGYDSMEYTEMNSDVNDYQSDDTTDEMSTEVKRFTENDKDIYDGLKLTEVREVRTYKATQCKYSPMAMYERKRR